MHAFVEARDAAWKERWGTRRLNASSGAAG